MSKQELIPQEKDRLIEILKEVNETKDKLLDKITSDFVFARHQISERDKTIQKIKDILC